MKRLLYVLFHSAASVGGCARQAAAKRGFLLLVAALLLATTSLWAQNLNVSGTVRDANNEPVVGASVVVKGSTVGVSTDASGGYTISAPADATLVFSFLGLTSKEEAVGGRGRIDITLSADDLSLDEVVVVGYGTMRKSDLTGSVSSVSSSTLQTTIMPSVDQMLSGKLAGVQVMQNTGAPGGATSIRIRGASSINNSNEPLYIVDGMRFQGSAAYSGFDWQGGSNGQTTTNPLALISPNDIESIDVLKDASAAAIYGAAGANGVIIITTKRGSQGGLSITYDGYMAAQQRSNTIDMMNLREFAQFQKDNATLINGSEAAPEYQDPSLLGEGTDWQSEVFRTALMQNHQLSVAGGNEKAQYAVSGGWTQQEGIIIGSDFSRFNVRTNIDATVNKFIKAGGSLAYTGTGETLTNNDGGDGVVLQALAMQPDIPVRGFDGDYASPSSQYGSSRYNPVWLALSRYNRMDRQRTNANLYAEATLLKDLKFRSEYGFDISNSLNTSFSPAYDFGAGLKSNNNQLRESSQSSRYWSIKNYFTYTPTFGENHSLNVMLGSETEQSEWRNSWIQKEYLSSDKVHFVTNDGDFFSNNGGKGLGRSVSFFARALYNFADRYLLTATLRADGSDKFGKNNKFGYFPSVALAWRVSNESFLKDVQQVSNLKLRVSYGQVGNSNIGSYLYGSSMQSVNLPAHLGGTGYRMQNIANPDLRWEASSQLNAGVDLGLFANRISFTADVYNKQSEGLLLQVSLPSYLGGSSWTDVQAPMVNIGQIRNRGVELSLNTQNIQTGDLRWSTSVVFSLNRNQVTALNDDAQKIYSGLAWYAKYQNITVTQVGQPIGVFYGYQTNGLFTDKNDILNSPVQIDLDGDGVNDVGERAVWPGDIKFKDLSGPDGKPDGKIDDFDQTIIGDPNPDFTYSIGNTVAYKDFELTVALSGSQGGDIFNWTHTELEGLSNIWSNQLTSAANAARVNTDDPNAPYLTNAGATVPRVTSNDNNDNRRASNRYIEDGSYLRIQNIALGYTLPASLVKRLAMQQVKVYVNLQNLYTFTKYSGFDPEIGAFNQSALLQNVDMGHYPIPRVYTVGLTIRF
ncbi:MAG: TonB-dependent receptor [Prevotellaceae bacterium]|jgi:TonB-linked SusC/RagA family outer membrane protein|nr:TonB-dependent receptor [Prevotellaceae bacterium]